MKANSESLLAFAFKQMEHLNKYEISIEHANAQANLIEKATNILQYELDRATLKKSFVEFNRLNKTGLKVRDIEE